MADCSVCGEPNSTVEQNGKVYCGECGSKSVLKDSDDITYDSNDPKNKELPFLRYFVLFCICGVVYFFKQTQ